MSAPPKKTLRVSFKASKLRLGDLTRIKRRSGPAYGSILGIVDVIFLQEL